LFAVVCVCAAAGYHLMRVAAAGGYSNAVDLYNSASGTWSTAQLSGARWRLAATSVRNVAIFAGGQGGGGGISNVTLCNGGRLVVMICVVCFRRVNFLWLCLRCSRYLL
jgi:dihydroorotase-like cyclic amidohydrolase